MTRQALFILACWLENCATAIFDRIGMADELPPVMVSRECLEDIHTQWMLSGLTQDEWADLYAKQETFH